MIKSEKVNIKVGTSIYTTYKDINIPLENPFKEFIDNSTQSYYDHKEILDSLSGFKNLIIKINTGDDKLVIFDNAFGMNKEDFDRALKLGARKSNYSPQSRGEFGIGLKYAAMYLGDKVTIESTEYGSDEKYTATLDSEELRNNIEEITRYIEPVGKAEHYTKITITKLRHEYSIKKIQELRDKLGRIYRFDINENGIEIIFNDNLKAEYNEPKLKINLETLSEYYETFSGEFIFGGKPYSYSGWIGILETGNVSDAGFSLIKSNRLIKMNYRPEKLFKKSNSFQYQRVIGEIDLNDWPVVSNKTDFIWSNGLEEEFIYQLSENKKVKQMFEIANKLRYKDDKQKQIDPKKINKVNDTVQSLLKPLKEIKKTQVEMKPTSPEEVKAYISSLDVTTKMNVPYEGNEYIFEFSYVIDESDDWLKVEVIDESKSKYRLVVNPDFPIFNKISKESDKLFVIHNFSVLFALAQISSRNAGFKDSYKFTQKINEILKVIGKSK